MNFFPVIGVGLGLIIGYFSVRYIAKKMGLNISKLIIPISLEYFPEEHNLHLPSFSDKPTKSLYLPEI